MLGGLAGVVASAEGQPTAQSYEVFDGLRTQAGDALASLASLLDTELSEFNAKVQGAGTAAVVV